MTDANVGTPGAATLQFVGTATTIIRCGPFTVMTDPNFLHRGERAYLGYGLTSTRLTDPALDVGDLPDLDVVVLSHLHGDHFDRVARRSLDRDIPILTTVHAARRLQAWYRFERAIGLRVWSTHTLVKDGHTLAVTALPARHATGLVEALLPQVIGSMLEFASPSGELECRLYVTGDTILDDALAAIPRRYPDIPTAVVHLGATTLPGGVMVTLDHRQGCDLVEMLKPGRVLPVHRDDYDVFKFDGAAWEDEVGRRMLTDRVVALERGDTVRL